MPAAATLERFADELRRYRHDPVSFARNVLGFEPHPGQAKWLEAPRDHPEADEFAAVTGNRWGKTSAAAVQRIINCTYKVGWTAETAAKMKAAREPYQSLNISVTADQAQLVWYKAHALLQGKRASWLVENVKLTPFPTIVFVNGAVFQARSTARDGHHLLGHSYDDVNWDEAAYEPKFLQIRDNVLRMRLVDRDGTLAYTSTGNKRNDFGQFVLDGMSYTARRVELAAQVAAGAITAERMDEMLADQRERVGNLYTQSGSSFDNPHISQERLRRNAARMSPRLREQNIFGSIIDGDGDFFDGDDLAAAVDSELNDMLKILAVDEDDVVAWCALYPISTEGASPQDRHTSWLQRYPSHRYLSGWDLADKADWAVGSTWDLSTTPRATLVEFERFNKRGWSHVKSRIRDRARRYGGVNAVDSTGVGDPILEDLADVGAVGMDFRGGRKREGLGIWKRMINLRQVRWPFIKPWVDEHAFYPGPNDDDQVVKDCVMSAVVSAWFMHSHVTMPAPASVLRT